MASTKARARLVVAAIAAAVIGGGAAVALLWGRRVPAGAPSAPASSAPSLGDVAVLRAARPHGARLATRPAGGGAGEASGSRLQSQLFQAALAAERAGRPEDAARIYRRLLERTPHGPLAEQARANLAAIEHGPR